MSRPEPSTIPRASLEESNDAPRATPRRGIVFVHGAGNFQPGYEKPWADELAKRLGGSIPHLAASYGDVLNRSATATALAIAPEPEEQTRFQDAFRGQLRRSYESIPPMQRTPRVTAFARADIAAAFESLTEQVAVYLFNTLIAAQVQNCVADVLDRAVTQFDDIVVASHSLGTVIAFDILRERADRYKISTWFTLGSPLAKLRRIGMRGDDLGAITRQNVAQWYNLYDSTDIVGGVIGPTFPRPGYRIHDIFVEVARDPIASHDYFRNSETLDLIADTLR